MTRSFDEDDAMGRREFSQTFERFTFIAMGRPVLQLTDGGAIPNFLAARATTSSWNLHGFQTRVTSTHPEQKKPVRFPNIE
jgi:hypothetical protein